MFKFVTLLALVGCAFAAPAPAPGYVAGHVVAAPVLHTQAYVAPAVRASYVAEPALAYHAAPVTYAHAAPLVSAYHAAPVATYAHTAPLATSHQQVTKVDRSSAIVSHPVAQFTTYQAAPAYAYVH